MRDRVCAGGCRHRRRHLRTGPPRARAGGPREPASWCTSPSRSSTSWPNSMACAMRATSIRSRAAARSSTSSALKRLRIECGLQIRDAIHFSSSPDGIQALQKEYSARREAGLDVASVKGTPLFRKIGANGFGLITHGNASVDPYKATIGLARAAVARGAKIFEQSPVTRIRPRRRTVDIKTEGGVVTASKVVVATGYPTDDFKPLRRRFARSDAYVVLTARAACGGAARDDAAGRDSSRHRLARSLDALDRQSRALRRRRSAERGRSRAGARADSAHRAADVRAVGHASGDFRAHAGILLGRRVIAHDRRRARTTARTETIRIITSRSPAAPAALGLSFAAARIILRHYQGTPDKGDEPFSFTRIRE